MSEATPVEQQKTQDESAVIPPKPPRTPEEEAAEGERNRRARSARSTA